jgi:four helix bundle protein
MEVPVSKEPACGRSHATFDTGTSIGWSAFRNNQEVTMKHETGFDALDKAIKAAAIAISVARGLPAPLRPLGDQVIRSASSVPANLAEGHGRSGRDRLHHYRISYGSAGEVAAHLLVLARTRSVDQTRVDNALQLFDDVRAMTWRLLHPKP